MATKPAQSITLREKTKQVQYPKVLTIALVLVFIGTLTFRVRSSKELGENPLDIAGLFRISCLILSALMALGTVSLHKISLRASLRAPVVRYCSAYAILGGIGSLLSPYPLMSLYKAVEILLTCGILVICAEYGFTRGQVFKPLVTLYACLGFLGCIIIAEGIFLADKAWEWRPSGWHWQIQGVFPLYSSNSVGELAGVLSVVSFGFWLKTRRFAWLATLSMSLALLVLAYSRTTLIACPVAMLFLLRVYRKRTLWPVAIIGLSVLIGFGLFGEWITEALKRGQDPGNVASLSGRMDWWRVALKQFWQSPYLGSGFGNVGTRFLVFEKLDTTSTLHSMWLQVLIESGIIGALPFFAMISCGLAFCVRAVRIGRGSLWSSINAAVLVFLFMRSFTSSVLVGYTPSLILFLLILLLDRDNRSLAHSS